MQPGDIVKYVGFNPRSREGSDSIGDTFPSVPMPSFNPRSREGSDYAWYNMCNRCNRVSIHAPAKGATFLY